MRIFPFKALRPLPEKARAFSVSAFDSEVREEAMREEGREAGPNYLHVLSPHLISTTTISFEESYKRSKKAITDFINERVLTEEDKPSLYIYRQLKGNNVFTCIIGLVSIEDYRHDMVKKHELTRTDKEEKITRYFKEVGVNGSPVLLTYPEQAAFDVLMQELTEPAPLYHFMAEDEYTEHFVWKVSEEKDLKRLQELFSKIECYYIADGHHRCAALAAMYPEVKEFMACLIADKDMKIHAFHRYVKKLNMGVDEFLDKLSKIFTVDKLEGRTKPQPQPGKFGIYMHGNWYEVTIPENLKHQANPRHNLDVYILDKYIFGDILGMADTRSNDNLSFMQADIDEDSLIKPVAAGNKEALFALSPIEAAEIFSVSDGGETMPPKSTWIEPKLRSGLLIHRF